MTVEGGVYYLGNAVPTKQKGITTRSIMKGSVYKENDLPQF
jgi:hypothetical protein